MQDEHKKTITVLKIKLKLAPGQGDELTALAALCKRGRNAGAVNWLLRQFGFPETQRQSERLCKHAKHEGKPKSESTKIYHAVRDGAPGLSGNVYSMLGNQINSYLSGRLDWREGKTEDGKRPRRRDAILDYRARPPYFTADEIPIRAIDAALTYGDVTTFSFRVLTGVTTTVGLRPLSGGHKRMLQEIASGLLKLPDSKILLRDNEWYLHLPVIREVAEITGGETAELWPTLPTEEQPERRPFRLLLPGDRTWGVGDGEHLAAQAYRFTLAKKLVGERYRHHRGHGHGRTKADDKQRQLSQHYANIVADVRARMIHDVLRQCLRHGVGTLLYREPSLPLREACWFAANGLEWNWTVFAANLENKLASKGIAMTKKQLGYKEVQSDKQELAAAGV